MCGRAADTEPAFFLFHMDPTSSKDNWLFVSWVPDRASVDHKMLYSSSKGRLKDKLGFNSFSDDLHAASSDELTWSAFQARSEVTDDRSEFEKAHDRVVQAEVSEAQERADAGAATMGAISAPSSHSSGGIGGFHSVKIPLSDSAKDAVRLLESGSANLLELKINDAKTEVDCASSQTISGNAALQAAISSSEPRFYAYAVPRPVPGAAKDVIFVYACPDAAPQNLRMVYSTSKNPVADGITDTCPSLHMCAKQLEIREGSELDEDTVREATRGRGGVSVIAPGPRPAGFGGYAGGASGGRSTAPDHGGTTNTRQNIQRVGGGGAGAGGGAGGAAGGQHPIYGLLGSNSTASGRKKIVIPPKHAW
jgi:Cofilin/tropomyosin-type actin-binding protein